MASKCGAFGNCVEPINQHSETVSIPVSPLPTQIINRKVVEMSMGMTNLINFDFLCLVFSFFFLTFLTNYEYDKNISVAFVDTGEVDKRRGRDGGDCSVRLIAM